MGQHQTKADESLRPRQHRRQQGGSPPHSHPPPPAAATSSSPSSAPPPPPITATSAPVPIANPDVTTPSQSPPVPSGTPEGGIDPPTAGGTADTPKSGLVPTIIRWTGGKAKSVAVRGAFTKWRHGQAVELRRIESEFMALVYLEPGVHAIFFEVDGKMKLDKNQAIYQKNNMAFNTITVNEHSILDSDDEDAPTPKGDSSTSKAPSKPSKGENKESAYSQKWQEFEDSRKFPPLFPPHLRYTPLNISPPGRHERTTQDTDLAVPFHVTINHVYFQAREGYNILGATYRHREKYTTVVYYKYEDCSQHRLADPNNTDESMMAFDE